MARLGKNKDLARCNSKPFTGRGLGLARPTKQIFWIMKRKRSSGFRRIFTKALDTLFVVNVNDCPAWLEKKAPQG